MIQTTQEAWKENHRTRDSCVLVTLDVKNAFNSARWVEILDALEHRFRVPAYLLRVVSDYLSDRELLYQTTEGQRSRRVTGRVVQGSALDPDLWNVEYDGILKIEFPEWAKLIGYADDFAAAIRARDSAEAQWRVAWVCGSVNRWLENHGLELAASKTEVMVLTRQRGFPLPLKFDIDGEPVTAGDTVKYLGEKVDRKLTDWPHIRDAAEKAAKMAAALARLMPNTNGPKPNKRRIVMSVILSIMLYGAEVWAEAVNAEKYQRKVASVQRRGSLRIVSAYRTVSEATVLVIA